MNTATLPRSDTGNGRGRLVPLPQPATGAGRISSTGHSCNNDAARRLSPKKNRGPTRQTRDARSAFGILAVIGVGQTRL